jgi:membrane protein
MKTSWATASRFGLDLWRKANDDNIWDGAAALAYYLMLALFPAVIFLLTLLPFLPIPDLTSHVMTLLHNGLPAEAADLLRSTVEQVTRKKHHGLLSFGLIFTLWSASSGMYATLQQLNITYGVKETRSFWRLRAMSMGLLLLFTLVTGVALTLLVLTPGIVVAAALRVAVTVGTLLLGFSVLFYYGPNVEQRFRLLSPGSVVGVLGLIATSFGIRIYVSHFNNFSSTYGSLGAVIILMLSLYLSGLVTLLGSEINSLVDSRKSAPIPEAHSSDETQKKIAA